nr:pectin acetylesterase 7-like [Ipomoea batatas]
MGFGEGNKVAVRYCDGSSFTGDVERVDPTTGLHFRGGLSVIIHCHRFPKRFPNANTVKCLSDGGFFLHCKDPTQAQEMESKFRGVVDLHNSTGLLPEACKNRMKDLAYLATQL